MRLTPLARRTAAVTAAAALISSGGALLAAPAWAVPGPATVTTFSPLSWDNRSTTTISVNGSGFVTNDPMEQLNDVVVLSPDFTSGTDDPTWKPDSTQHTEINDIVSEPAAFSATGALSAKIDLALAPAGVYTLHVEHADGTPSNTALQKFEVFGYGGASATSVSPGTSNTGVDPVGVDCRASLFTNCTPRGAGALDLHGSNIAVGATVHFYKKDNTEDTGLTFLERNPQNDATYAGTKSGTGYASSALLQGNYSWTTNGSGAPSFTPGYHKLTIRNVHQDPNATTVSTSFVQPYFTPAGVSPATIGQGAQKVLLTLTGEGFTNGASIGVGGGTCGTPSVREVTVGAATVSNPDPSGDGTYRTITAPVSFATCAATGPRGLSVVNPSGAYFPVSGALTVTGRPTFTQINPADYQVLGQGAQIVAPTRTLNITGTNFAGAGQTDQAKMVSFDFGDGVTATTRSVTSASSAQVDITVSGDAPVSLRAVTVTNPDGGSTTTQPDTLPDGSRDPSGSVPLEVEAGPHISSVSPSSYSADSSGGPVTITGSFPNTTSGAYAVTIDDVNVSNVSRTDATHLTLSISIPPNKPSGLKKVVVTDTTNYGEDSCSVCFGLNKMTVAPDHAANNVGAQVLTFTNGDPTLPDLQGGIIAGKSTIVLSRQVAVPGQGSIVGTSVVGGPGADQAQGTFDLRAAAPGAYSVTITQDPAANPKVTWTCAACFLVTAAGSPSISAVTPTSVGQGVNDVPLVITGSSFSKGSDVTITGVSVHDLQFISTTELRVKVNVEDDATAGARPVTVTDAGGSSGSKANAFTVTLKPAPKSISVTALGQGAGTDGSTINVTIAGAPGSFSSSSVPSLGTGITFGPVTYTAGHPASNCAPPPINTCATPAQDDVLTTKITVLEPAATGKRDLTVTNGQYGGSGTLVDAFTVNPGPKVTSIATEAGQSAVKPGSGKHTITILGSGFSTTDPKTALAIKNLDKTDDSKLTVENVQVVDAGKITADVTAAADAALGARLVTLANSGDKGYGTCTTCFGVANPPSAPASVTVTSAAGGLKVTWVGSAPNGSPVSSYVLSLIRAGSATSKTTGSCKSGAATTGVKYDTLGSTSGAARSFTFTGLSNGATYYLTMCALNGAGQSPTVVRSGIAGLPSTLTLATSVSKLTYGSKVTLSGRLLGVGNAPLRYKTVYFVLRTYKGYSYTHVSTDTNGYYRFTYAPQYNTSAYSYWLGDASYRLVKSATRAVSVSARVLKTSPASGSKSSYTTTLKITGSVGPNLAGKTVYLYRYVNGKASVLAKATLTSTSTYTFVLKPGRGTYSLRVYMPYTPGNTSGFSSFFTLYRV